MHRRTLRNRRAAAIGLRALGLGLLAVGLGAGLGAVRMARADALRAASVAILDPGRTDAAILAQIAAAGTAEDWPDAGAVTVFDSTRVIMEDSGLSHRRQRLLRKVLTPEGARDLAAPRFDYDPASNQVTILSVRVHRADSTFVAVDPAAAADVFAPAHMIYWGARTKVLQLPRLAVGDAVETITEKMGFQIAYLMESQPDRERYIPPMRGHFYEVILFQKDEPLKSLHYRLIVPREKVAQYTVYNGEVYSALGFTDTTLVYDWWVNDRPAITGEVYEPDRSDFVPKVVLATVPNWEEKSRWFFQVNDPVFAANDEIAARVRELTRGLKTDEEKMAVLLHWTADNIRFSGLNMGKGEGYTLHPGIMTYEERCGVCKDIAGMLVTLLRAAGYTTYPVMTMAGARVETVPADQFNHCVVAVRRDDGSYVMLDPTWAPQSREIWSHAEGEQNFVIGSPEGESLSAIRSFTAEENRLEVAFETRLDATGALEGRVELTGRGYMDNRLRRNLTYRTRAEWPTFAAEVLGGISPALELTAVEFGTYDDYARPMRYAFGFRAPAYAALNDSTVDLALPSARFLQNARRFLRIIQLPAVEERKHPALFWAPGQIDVSETLSLPRAATFADALPEQELDRDAAAYRATVRVEGSKLRTEQQLTLKRRTVEAEAWSGVAEVADSLASFAARRLHGTR
jgi:hypothetical protein